MAESPLPEPEASSGEPSVGEEPACRGGVERTARGDRAASVWRAHRWLGSSRVIFAALGAVAIVAGFREFLFSTDDAYIAFRYVRNLLDGHGLVWNPAPFHRVDGYTSFGWVMVLAAAAKVTGRSPPELCNGLTLSMALATWGTFVVAAGDVLDRTLGEAGPDGSALEPRRRNALARMLLGVVGLGLVTNRTFLTWTSSGLETAMFSCLIMGWTATLLRRRSTALPGLLVALAALTRPEGLLAWGLTLIWLAWRTTLVVRTGSAVRDGRRKLALAWTLTLVPVIAHAIWHRVTYAAWLPNTYYAKVAGLQWRLGVMYVESFFIEYTAWPGLLWIAGAGVWALRRRRLSAEPLVVAAFAGGLLGYYGVKVGGDHFEFKVFHVLVPLYWLGLGWALALAARVATARALVLGLGVFLVMASWPIPWGHHLATRELRDRKETFKLRHAMAPYAPPLLRRYVATYDAMQSALIDKFFCMRHREHAAFFEWKLKEIPESPDRPFDATNPDVALVGEIGLLGYRYPWVAVIDVFGLNDRFVAHYRRESRSMNRVGHNAIPPPGYLKSFDANIVIEAGKVRRREHRRRLSPDRVVAIERRAAALVGQSR